MAPEKYCEIVDAAMRRFPELTIQGLERFRYPRQGLDRAELLNAQKFTSGLDLALNYMTRALPFWQVPVGLDDLTERIAGSAAKGKKIPVSAGIVVAAALHAGLEIVKVKQHSFPASEGVYAVYRPFKGDSA